MQTHKQTRTHIHPLTHIHVKKIVLMKEESKYIVNNIIYFSGYTVFILHKQFDVGVGPRKL